MNKHIYNFDPMGYVKKRTDYITQLREQSDYYPLLLITNKGDFDNEETKVTYVSTLVRVQNEDGIWYKVHCVQNAVLNPLTNLSDLILRAMKEFHMIQYLYIVGPDIQGTEIDECQLTEKERLLNLHNKLLKKRG